jgi:hypothetical protein
MSYQTVTALLQRITGQALVCRQTLTNWVEEKAQEINDQWEAEVQEAQSLPLPRLAKTVDLYDPQAEEIAVFSDGILVKAQKPTHERAGKPKQPKPDSRHETELMLIQSQDGQFRYLAGSSDQRICSVQAANAFWRREWGGSQIARKPVAITDGAQKIRRELPLVFGAEIPQILDWYHLEKRVYQQLSMSAHSQKERENWEQQVLGLLWRGQVEPAVCFLETLVPRNAKALTELMGYLQKHEKEIIDYERRQAAGKPIGSGRMEKAVDQVVGMRQKGKGMSWSKSGSQALALLKVVELNNEWHLLWSQQSLAA